MVSVPLVSEMLIDGEWIGSRDHNVISVFNPANGEPVGAVPAATAADVASALEAAQRAFESWRATSPDVRAGLMHNAARLIRERSSAIGRMLTLEQGKPLGEAVSEVRTAAEALDFYAEEATRVFGEIIPNQSGNILSLVTREPIGVVACIAPWNFPLILMSWEIGPALAAGCTVVAKPATKTPLATIEMFRCLVDAGFPRGVVNLVTGSGRMVGAALVQSPITKKVAFTGETATGREIMRMAATNLVRVSLELGGNSPLIVCEDADLEAAVDGATKRAFRNMGQVCNSINRIYVHSSVAPAFTAALVERVRRLVIDDGLENPRADLGPMATPDGLERVNEHIRDAVARGARILCGGKAPEGEKFAKGLFFEPTVLVGVNHDMKIMREETFGPVAPIMEFERLGEAIRLANDTIYGLVAYAYTTSLETAMVLTKELRYGTVDINNVVGGDVRFPYAGWGQSGVGVELSHLGLGEYLLVKHSRIQFTQA